jgi:Fic-DOC domain mobile mystery protein B
MARRKHLPGETPYDDVSGLKPKCRGTRAEINELEAENVRQATVKYLAAKPSRRMAPFDLSWARKLHREMFGKVWKWAGMFRTTPSHPVGVAPIQIEMALANLLENLKVWEREGRSPFEVAAWLHHKAVQIHPFQNGNGRWARLLANTWLKRGGYAITTWPAPIGEESAMREEYIAALKHADDGEYSRLLEMHRKFALPRGT